MKKIITTLLLVTLLSVACTNTACAQAITADTLKSWMIKDWERAMAYTNDYMKAMPDDKYSFKASDSVRSFAQQLLHLAEANTFFASIATGASLSAGGAEKRAGAQTAELGSVLC